MTDPMWLHALAGQASAAAWDMRQDKVAAREEYRCVGRCTLRQDHAHDHDFYVSTAGGAA